MCSRSVEGRGPDQTGQQQAALMSAHGLLPEHEAVVLVALLA